MRQMWTAEEWRRRWPGSVAPLGAASRAGAVRRRWLAVPRRRRAWAPVVLWLALLIWPTPQVGNWFAMAAPHLTTATVSSVETLTARLLRRIPDGLGALTGANQEHVYWQVGLSAGDEDRDASGLRATIVTTLPQRVSANTTNYFWAGSYLADGSFVQVGYYVPAHDASEAGWFYCAFHADGKEGPCAYGPLGSVGVNGASHTYTLESSDSPLTGTAWRAELDGGVIGEFSWPVATSGTNTPTIYAESSGFSAHAAKSVLGPVDFRGAMEVRTSGSATYARPARLFAVYSAPNVCPPYGISSDGNGGALLGSGLSCPEGASPFA
jgi:hypothetical protein